MGEQGQSVATEAKIRGVSQLLGINFAIFKARFSRFTYFHFDLHAGCGWNDQVNVIGSPLAALSAARTCGLSKYAFHFVEIDLERAKLLARCADIASDQSAFVHCGDNAEFVLMIPEIIRMHGEDPRMAIGSIFIDPNKPTSETPWDQLRWVLKQCSRIDVIVNFPSTGMKRIGRTHAEYLSINELPVLLNKKDWLIRDPQGPWQWCLTIGRNYQSGDWRSQGFVYWNSERGKDIRLNVNHTKKELITTRQLGFL